MATRKKITDLTMRAPFKDLFPTDPEVVEAITKSMKEEGYDTERPIFAWRADGELVVVDGHSRLAAADKAKIKEVPVVIRRFKSEDAAFNFAVSEQRDRRNLTKTEIAEAIATAELAKSNGSIGSAKVAKPKSGGKNKIEPGWNKDPVKQAVVKKAAKQGISKRVAERGLARAKGKAESTPAKKKQDREKAALSLAPPEMRKCHELVAHALDDLRKAKRYAREANATTLENIKKTEKLSGEIRQIIEKENE